MANNKFLQILRNFDSQNRAAAIAKLNAAASSDSLYHAGTPIVAFYTQESMSFANRASAKTYGSDTTSNYKALLGVMGNAKGSIEIFDIQTSVEHLLGGASQITTTSANSVGANQTWDFTSLGGIQVVIENMDEVITTKITDLGTRITNITGQSGSTYVAATAASDQNPNGVHYISNASDLQDAAEKLDAALYAVSQTVSGNAISNTDRSIIVTAGANDTDIHVNIKSGEHVLANDNTANAGGLYTDIKIAKVVASGEGTGDASGNPADDEIVGTLGTNVKEAFALKATDGTMLGEQINIYNDSALQEVYLGASTDTINASTGVITKNQVTDPQSMNFAYQLADGTYELVKIDVSKFLTESEFGDGLSVSNAGVVSVKAGAGLIIDSNDNDSVAVNPGNGIEIDTDTVAAKIGNGLEFAGTNSDEITVKIDSTNDSNGYLSVGANGVAFNGNAIADAIENAATTLTPVAAQSPAETTADGTDFIKVVASTESDGHTNYAVSTQGIKDYVAGAVDALDGEALASTAPTAVSYSGTNGDEFQVLTRVNEVNGVVQTVDATANSTGSKSVTLKKVAATGAAADVSITDAGSDYTATTVEGALGEIADRLDTVEGTAGTALQSVSGSDAISIDTTTSPADANNPVIELVLDETSTSASSPQTITGSSNVAQITQYGLYVSNVWDCGEYTIQAQQQDPIGD